MSKIVAVANQKGGVGKTTHAVNLGFHLANAGRKVLFVDFDPQRDLTKSVAKELFNLESFQTGSHPANIINMMMKEDIPKPYTITDSIDIIGASKEMSAISQAHIMRFANALDEIMDEYDYIIFDCPPSAGELQNGALLLADRLVIVCEPSELSLEGVAELMQTSRNNKRLNPRLTVAGILLNKVKGQITNEQARNAKDLRDAYKELVFDSEVRDTIRASEALAAGVSLHQYNPKEAEKFGFVKAMEEIESRLNDEAA